MVAFIRSDLEFILAQIDRGEACGRRAVSSTFFPTCKCPGACGRSTARSTTWSGSERVRRRGQPVPAPARLRCSATRGRDHPTRRPAASWSISQPRIISNLIVDQTANNPAAVAAAAANPGSADRYQPRPGRRCSALADDTTKSFFIPNVTPDAGLSAPFNAWFTFFGQFFDHGLDLVTKGGNGTVFIPLQPDDPLFVDRAARPTSWC